MQKLAICKRSTSSTAKMRSKMNDFRAFESSIHSLMAASSIPGVSLATVENGEVKVMPMGVAELDAMRPVVETTVFDAASLSKPVTAYIALQLVDSGAIELDQPLSRIVPKGVPPQLASSPITVRHVLTHTSGLPNLRSKEPLRTYFPPGSWFSYSSVGFTYLQMALEAVTTESLEALAKRLVFDPLEMQSSSFQWHERFNEDYATPHEDEKPLEKHRPAAAQASYSLQTTAGDYAKFIGAVLDGTSLTEATRRQWLAPAVRVPREDAIHLADSAPETERDVGWGLGWGFETTDGTFFQWGKMDGVRAFAMGNPHTQSAIVLLTNSNRGLRLMEAAAKAVLPGHHPAFSWLQASVTE
ncbi:CubicO group peptidase (beta-lactamase class C family) [Rhodoferax ferrireducens]|uniref:CubicO group peptidase (Beta-lactamase class C family) n=1 Tax=Rhodoferax ferrireducens TaxID=192843 RepID=A0ABU2CAC8_9BURK|nr:serine hydrolase domain-containing protein [Rhodoferax ferrireducens]MDR7378278.1 CubicO group peptidase (beta-lactamase class C family) [Rhodoferax ferrireducens]